MAWAAYLPSGCQWCFYRCSFITHVFLILHTNDSTLSGARKRLRFQKFPIKVQNPSFAHHSHSGRGGHRHISHNRHTRRRLRHTIRQTTSVTKKVHPRITTTLRILPLIEKSGFVLPSCRALLCPLSPACSSSSILVLFSVSHSPSIFCTKSDLHPACPIFSPYRGLPNIAFTIFPIFDKYFLPCACSLHLHVLTASSTSHTSILVGLSSPLRSMLRFLLFLIHENPFFFCLWLELFTIHVPCIFMYLLPLPHLIYRYLLASVHHSVRCFVSSCFLSMKIHFFFLSLA